MLSLGKSSRRWSMADGTALIPASRHTGDTARMSPGLSVPKGAEERRGEREHDEREHQSDPDVEGHRRANVVLADLVLLDEEAGERVAGQHARDVGNEQGDDGLPELRRGDEARQDDRGREQHHLADRAGAATQRMPVSMLS